MHDVERRDTIRSDQQEPVVVEGIEVSDLAGGDPRVRHE
jgi:hypothetical protein